MITLKLKVAVLFLTTLNTYNLLSLPKFEISISPFSSLLPASFNNSSDTSLKACVPDLTLVLDEGVKSMSEKSYMSCWRDVGNCKNGTHPDIGKTTSEIITSYGYPLEVHKVTTKDGYILTVHRIPKRGAKPVYLQHGFGGCSDTWLFMYKERSLAFLLWEFGFDVWLGNFRGTTYSLEHLFLKWDDPKNFSYWNFSWHENGIYDIPAIVDLILQITGKSKLVYVGYSMGTTAYFVALDLVPEINEKIETGILLGPGGFIARSPNPVRILAPLEKIMETRYLNTIFQGRIDEPRKLQELLGVMCTPTAVRCRACAFPIFALFGFDAPQMNYTNVPNIVSRYPNIISLKTIYHYAQGMNQCGFRQYDYGREKNIEIYNSPVPPSYNLSSVKVRTHTFHAPADNFFVPEDVKRTLDLLPNGTLIENIMVNSTYFNHADFVIAKDANVLVYQKVLKIIKRIS